MTESIRVTAAVEVFFNDPGDAKAMKCLWETGLDDTATRLAFSDVPPFALPRRAIGLVRFEEGALPMTAARRLADAFLLEASRA